MAVLVAICELLEFAEFVLEKWPPKERSPELENQAGNKSMYLYPFSKLTGKNSIRTQGASLKQAEQPTRVSNAEGGQIFPAEGATNRTNFFGALPSGMVYTFSHRFASLVQFASFNKELRV